MLPPDVRLSRPNTPRAARHRVSVRGARLATVAAVETPFEVTVLVPVLAILGLALRPRGPRLAALGIASR